MGGGERLLSTSVKRSALVHNESLRKFALIDNFLNVFLQAKRRVDGYSEITSSLHRYPYLKQATILQLSQ